MNTPPRQRLQTSEPQKRLRQTRFAPVFESPVPTRVSLDLSQCDYVSPGRVTMNLRLLRKSRRRLFSDGGR